MLDFGNLPPRLRRADVPEYLYHKHGIRVAPTTLASWAVAVAVPAFKRTADGRCIRWPIWTAGQRGAFHPSSVRHRNLRLPDDAGRTSEQHRNEKPPGSEPGGEKCCVPFNPSRLLRR